MTSEASQAPEARFDELIHPSTRLSIVALLASADWIDFAYVRDRLELSDSALSKQFATLETRGTSLSGPSATGAEGYKYASPIPAGPPSRVTSPRCAQSLPARSRMSAAWN